jgi:hypothetical protein
MRLILAVLCWAVWAARAADIHAGPDDYRQFLGRLQAGDRLLLAPGDYLRGLPLQGLNGEAGRPILIEGLASGPPARFLARRGANTVSLVDVRHVVIRHLELDGQRLPVDAVKAEGHSRHAHFVTLEKLHIHDHDASQQSVGISTKCPAYGWVVRGNRIERVGTGMYFGDSDGSDPFVAGLIEDNHVSGTLGYNLQIKHQRGRPEGLPGAGQRHDTIIRRNFFGKETGANAGALARPNVLVGHWPLAGEGIEDRYLIYANLFWQNPTEALFQGEGNVALYNNVFVNRQGSAVNIRPHNDRPREVAVFHNTVLSRGRAIRVEPGLDNPHVPRVMLNLARSIDDASGAEAAARIPALPAASPGWPLSATDGLGGLDMPADETREILPPGLSSLPDADRDYAGRPRLSAIPGALVAPLDRLWPPEWPAP